MPFALVQEACQPRRARWRPGASAGSCCKTHKKPGSGSGACSARTVACARPHPRPLRPAVTMPPCAHARIRLYIKETSPSCTARCAQCDRHTRSSVDTASSSQLGNAKCVCAVPRSRRRLHSLPRAAAYTKYSEAPSAMPGNTSAVSTMHVCGSGSKAQHSQNTL